MIKLENISLYSEKLIFLLIFICAFSVSSENRKLSLRELELKDGRIVEVKAALKFDDNTLKVRFPDGKNGSFKRDELSEREQLRRFGKSVPKTIFKPVFESLESELPADFNPNSFVNSFKVRGKDLKEGAFPNPFYKMEYRYFVPENLPEGSKVPLVVFFHGVGECGGDNIRQLKLEQPLIFVQPWIQKEHPCFFLAPQLNRGGSPWIGTCGGNPEVATPQMQAAIGIIDEMIKKYPEIDEDRVYVTGLSSGGLGAFEAVLKYPGKFAGAVPASAGWDYLLPLISHRQRIAVWAFYNRNEHPNLKRECDEVLKKITKYGGQTRVTSYQPAGNLPRHASWLWAYAEPELIPWLFSNRRDKTALTRNTTINRKQVR